MARNKGLVRVIRVINIPSNSEGIELESILSLVDGRAVARREV